MRIISRLSQRVRVGATELTRGYIRFIDSASVTWGIVDDPTNDEIEITATATGGGGGGVTVEEDNSALGTATSIDFGSGFDVSFAAGEADVGLDLSEIITYAGNVA